MNRRLHILLTRHRRLLAALLAAAAVILLASPDTDPQGTRPVIVARKALSGGSQIGSAEIAVVRVPAALVPDQALISVDKAAGQTLVADRSRGSILTEADLLSAPRAGPGRALTGVRLSDPSLLPMLRVGMVVTIVTVSDGSQAVVLARSAVIRAISHTSSQGSLAAGTEPVIVVSTDPQSAARIATQSSGQGVGVVME
ncbi:SAF domain-containing protein [Acidipropionibacterium virtanenii]|uniref:SAF domain-containing protein n=1 Tax=Acidipropionibacterium virtanenii TaxID=2057246 RepID=A0A344UW74_9ACTN|nr:SAF domain-containing protein [Acidipropionibacterium virtanenii]AXE39522.1 hypothetical protein JS278_02382 [Acidipropionibacterium virtanenii]